MDNRCWCFVRKRTGKLGALVLGLVAFSCHLAVTLPASADDSSSPSPTDQVSSSNPNVANSQRISEPSLKESESDREAGEVTPAQETGSSERNAETSSEKTENSVETSEAEAVRVTPEPVTDPASKPEMEERTGRGPDQLGETVDAPRPSEEEDGSFPEVFSFSNDSAKRTHWASVGAFVGVASRPSGAEKVRYRPGIARGVFLRPQLLLWLGAVIFVRWEDIPVEVESEAFDTATENHNFDFEQPDLKGFSMGLRLEPSYRFNEYLSVLGVLHWSWYRFEAEAPTASDFSFRVDRQGSELNWGLGAGVSVEVIPGWIDVNVSGTYNFVSTQTGSAYDEVQAIVDGQMTHFAGLPKLQNSTDVLVRLGLIF